MARDAVPVAGRREIGIAVSIGVSCYPNCADNPQAVVDRADRALYVAKGGPATAWCSTAGMLKKRIDEDPSCIVALSTRASITSSRW